MDEKAFLQYLIKINKISEKQAQHSLQLSLTQKLPLAHIFIQQRLFSEALLDTLTHDFQQTQQEATVSNATSEKENASIDGDTLKTVLSGNESLEGWENLSQKTTLETQYSSKNNIDKTELNLSFNTTEFPTAKQIIKEKERYHHLKTLGEGGMGVVELVIDQQLGREVALKKIKMKGGTQLDDTQKIMLFRLSREASITAMLEHPNIVPLHDMQETEEGDVYFTMRKVQGDTLRTILQKKREGTQEIEQRKLLSIFYKVCDAIGYAHNQGVIHRDLKPDNIMVGEFGEVYVMDWGIAKSKQQQEFSSMSSENALEGSFAKRNFVATEFQTVGGLGTPGYMSPEQHEDASLVNQTSDIYALGKMLRETFTLISPMEEFYQKIKKNQQQRKLKKKATSVSKTEEPLENKIPPDVLAIVNKATEEAWQNRYQSVQELVYDLENYQKDLRVSVKDYSLIEIFLKWFKRNRTKILVFSFFVALVIVFFLYNWIQIKVEFDNTFELATKISQEASQQGNDEQKTQQFLKSLKSLNHALSLKPENKKTESLKWEIGKQLITLACEAQNYQLADYIVADLELLSTFDLARQSKITKQIFDSKTKLLKEHQTRLLYWKNILLQTKVEARMRDKAIFEISKMQEPQIVEELLQILAEGLKYYLESTTRSTRKDEYYCIMITALGRIGNKTAGKHLLKALERMTSKLKGFVDKPLAEIDYMVALADALANLKLSEFGNTLNRIRWMMGQNKLFWVRTDSIIKDLLQHNTTQKSQFKNFKFYNNRGLSKKFLKDFKGAIEDYSQAIKLNPLYSGAYNNRGCAKSDLGDLRGAILDFDQAIKINSQYSEAYSNRGNTKLELGDLRGAILDFDQAIKLNPQYSEAYSNRGITKLGLKDLRGAVLDFDQAIKLNPLFSEAYCNRGSVKFDLGDLKKAILDFDQAIKLNPQYSEAYSNRGNAKLELGNLKGAIVDYNQSIKLNPQYSEAYSNRGIAKSVLGDLKGAILDFDQAIKLDPKFSEAYCNRGGVKFDLGNLKGALEDFNQAIKLNPRYSDAYCNRGLTKSGLGDNTGAIADFDQAIKLEPTFSEACCARGDAKSNLGNFKGAIEDYNQAIKLNPQLVEAYSNRGITKSDLGYFQGAIEDYSQAIKLNPQHSSAYNNRALAKWSLGNLKEALLDFNQAIKLNPQSVETYFNRGTIRKSMEDFQGAIEDFTKIILFNSKAFKAYFRRGFVYLHLNQKQKALNDFKVFLKLTETYNSPQTQKAKELIYQEFPALKSE